MSVADKIIQESKVMSTVPTKPDFGRIVVEDLPIEFKAPGDRKVEALARTDLEIEPGSFVSLIGPSGCGKSTLLNAVGGSGKPATGSIRLGGVPVTGLNPSAGVVFQQYALFPWFNALGNVLIALMRRHVALARTSVTSPTP